jgi:hypothetical protein
MCRKSARLTTANLNDETAAVPVKLKRKQINALRPAPTKMGKRASETTLAQQRHDNILQCLAHLVA